MKKAIISLLMIMILVQVSVIVGAKYSFIDETTSIGGKVTDSNGKPLAEALVIASYSCGCECAVSDDLGHYVVYNIPIFEEIKINCFKEQYKTFQTSVYIDVIGVCLILDIELQEKNNIIIENPITHCNTQSVVNLN